MKRGRPLLIAATAMFVAAAYPAFVLGYTWWKVAASEFPGGRHGPLDAYRHALASAVVAFTLDPRVVHRLTPMLERGQRRSNRMDRHNNRIGAGIGSRARAFREVEPAVRAEVLRGAVNACDPLRITWLPPERWRTGLLW